jgi:4-diphosphocytidyl-2-C-methyl-D-erythritol kinase
MIHEISPAKLNLYLHINHRRSDGYHDLTSLVVFWKPHDRLYFLPTSTALTLRLKGPMAPMLNQPYQENLVYKAAKIFCEWTEKPLIGTFILEKNLPPAAGLGGGSSNAAATLRLLAKIWGIDSRDLLTKMAQSLGADVLVCLNGKASMMSGIGDRIESNPLGQALWAVGVNPLFPLSTKEVFNFYDQHAATPTPFINPNEVKNLSLVEWLKAQNNHLEPCAAQ